VVSLLVHDVLEVYVGQRMGRDQDSEGIGQDLLDTNMRGSRPEFEIHHAAKMLLKIFCSKLLVLTGSQPPSRYYHQRR
jgi:hypothetical protein